LPFPRGSSTTLAGAWRRAMPRAGGLFLRSSFPYCQKRPEPRS